MNYRNSSVYVQRQIDRVLRSFAFARVYVNNIVIFSESFEKHIEHLRKIFQTLTTNNISINSKKAFLEYSSINFLNQHVTSLDLFTNEEKLQIIFNFTFLKTLDKLKIYFELTDWFRQYIESYAAKFKSLQNETTFLL